MNFLSAGLLCIAVGFHLLNGDSPISWSLRWALVTGDVPEGFSQLRFMLSDLPRTFMALLTGATLGITGSAIQQFTQNPLASPLTLGTAAGAWLGIVIGAIVAPSLLAQNAVWFSLLGAALATAAVISIAGLHRLESVSLVVAGMALNIALGSVATLLTLLNTGYVDSWFIWGAGDLTQVDWEWSTWFLPQVIVGVVILLAMSRVMGLLRLGSAQAAARGLAVIPCLLLGLGVCLWLTASAITAVGVIGFVGLMSPHLARLLGARTPARELVLSSVLGACALLLTDAIVLLVSSQTRDIIPSGAGAALIGAPGLVWVLWSRLPRQQSAISLAPALSNSMHRYLVPMLACLLLMVIGFSLLQAPSQGFWSWAWPSALEWELRVPRIVAAAAAGAGMGLSGLVLQRLFRNPLVSPDIVGISAGATLALIVSFLFFGVPMGHGGAPIALFGGLVAMGIVLLLGIRQKYSGGALVLVGLSLTAFTESLVQFSLAAGGEDSYRILTWLAGSTYRVDAGDAMMLAAAVIILSLGIRLLGRWLALIELGDSAAAARGLAVARARTVLLSSAASLAALVTALLGPVAFVGLVAPHIARLSGARTLGQQMSLSLLIGAMFFSLADSLGRSVLYPRQLPAGAICAVLGSLYLAGLMIRTSRLTAR